jgi:hypothetical protein
MKEKNKDIQEAITTHRANVTSEKDRVQVKIIKDQDRELKPDE